MSDDNDDKGDANTTNDTKKMKLKLKFKPASYLLANTLTNTLNTLPNTLSTSCNAGNVDPPNTVVPKEPKLYIGFHIEKTNLFMKLQTYPLNAFQIFMSAPISSTKGSLIKNIQGIKKLMKEKDVFGIIHGKYIYNFARKRTSQYEWMFTSMINDMQLTDALGLDIIIHQGKNMPEEHMTRDQAVNTFVFNLQDILKATNTLKTKIVLENSARQGNELGYSLDELYKIWSLFTSEERKRITFCIDLCHIFVAGELDMRKGSDVKAYLEKWDSLIGLNNIACFHCNDSAIDFNKKNDHHADISIGYIGSVSMSGFGEIVKIAYKYRIPIILETPNNTCDPASQIAMLYSAGLGDSCPHNPLA